MRNRPSHAIPDQNREARTARCESLQLRKLGSWQSKARLVGIFALASVLTACGGRSDEPGDADNTDAETTEQVTSATITKVEPIKETIQTPREVCEDVVVTEQAEVKDQHQVGGTVAGAAVGGIIGNQVGSGRGKTVATAAGAAAGGYIGNKAQERHQEGKTTTTTEQQCSTVTDTEERVIGYLVTYNLNGTTGTIKMDQAPSGSTLPVVDGKVAL